MEMLAGPAGRPQPDSTQLIREDLVQKISNPQQIGIVSKLPGDESASTSNLGTTGEDSVDGEHNCNIPAGSARIAWLRSPETDEDVTDLRVLDRSFILGDVVAPLADPIGQTGIVVDIGMSVDLELPSGDLVEGIDSRRLRRVHTYMPGDFVICSNWLGRIEEVMDNVTVMFERGAKCKIFRANTERLIPVQSGLIDDTNSPYYPGQRVRGATPAVFKSAKWLKGTWKATRNEGTVGIVEVGLLLVYWITSAITLSGASAGIQSLGAPSMLQKPSALLPLMYISHTNWQLGDWPLLPPGFEATEHTLAAGDEGARSDQEALDYKPVGHGSPIDSEKDEEFTMSSTSFDKEVIIGTLNIHKEIKNKQQKKVAKRERRGTMRRERGAEHAALVVKSKTKVDVLWQDGTKLCGIEASSLIPIEYLEDHEFWPEEYVLDRGLDGEGIDHLEHRVGIVKSIDAKQRTAVVRWLQQKETLDNPPEIVLEEIVSVYEIVQHPHFNFCLGNVVMRLTTNQPKMNESESSKGQEQALPSEHASEVAPHAETEVEHELASDDQPKVASDENLKMFKKEKWLSQRQGRERRSNHYNRHIVDLSWVGNVIELKDGEIQVLWADGNISKVGPQDIFVINNEEEEFTLDVNEVDIMHGNDALTWTQLEFNEEVEVVPLALVLNQSSEVVLQIENNDVREKCTDCMTHNMKTIHDKKTTLQIQNMKTILDVGPSKCSPRQYTAPLATACKKFISQMACVIRNMKSQSSSLRAFPQSVLCCSDLHDVLETYHTRQRSNLSVSSSNINAKQDLENTLSNSRIETIKINFSCNIETNYPPKVVGHDTTYSLKSSSRELHNDLEVTGLYLLLSLDSGHHTMYNMEPPSNEEQIHEEIQEPPKCFKQFDSVCGAIDHHFVDLTYPNPQKKWIKKIQTEWKILKENLPDSIYVRVYEDRMDLLRIMIVGVQGTPYHDCLFIFDFHLPQEFPLVPPVAYYHSGGLRLNPNLYENGNVCLSLLNTWRGKGSELWEASNSSILQLLVSLQGLVLNVAPYFNEAGYERQIRLLEGKRNSLMYNENAFLLSCKSILHLLCQPPQHFEPLIWQHFKQRGSMLLKACAAYMNGALVGSLDENLKPKAVTSGIIEKSTVGFRIMLDKLMVKLTAEFAKLGSKSNLPLLESASCSIIATST